MASTLRVGDALKNPGQEFPFEADAMVPEMEVLGDPVRIEEITVSGTVVGTGATVGVKAEIRAKVESLCARCREKVFRPIVAELDAEFAREPDSEDPDLYTFEGTTLDLSQAIGDALVLALPFRFLCKEDCKGLCPKCGANLNKGSCSCPKDEDDSNPFAALRLIVDHNEEV